MEGKATDGTRRHREQTRRATPKVRAFIDLAVGMLRANTALN